MNSVFVPNVFGLDAEEIKVLMEKYFGQVSDIDYILNTNGDWQAFVHFQSWHDREIVYKAIKTMEQGKGWKLRIPEKQETIVLLKNKSKKVDKPVLDSETKRNMLLKILHPHDSPISEHSGSKAPRVNNNFNTKVVDTEYVEKIEKELMKARKRITDLESSYKKKSAHTHFINDIRMLDDAKTEYDRIHNQVPVFRNLIQSPIPSPKSPDYAPPSRQSETYKEQMRIAEREEESRKIKEKRITELLEKAEEKLEEVIIREEGEVDEDNASTCVHYPDTPEIREECGNEVKMLSLQHPEAITIEKYDRASQCWY